MTDLNSPSRIVPRAIPPGGSLVRPLDIAIRTLADYDVSYMEDRVVSEIFINGMPTSLRSVCAVRERPSTTLDRADLIARHAPELERKLVHAMLGGDIRRDVALLSDLSVEMGKIAEDLADRVTFLENYISRDRWWQLKPLRRLLSEWRLSVANAISPKGDS